MLFNSTSFLGSFAIFTLVYYAVPHGRRWLLLTVASLAFYALFAAAVVVLLGVTLITYLGGLTIERAIGRRKCRILLSSTAGAVLGVLIYSKFFGSFGTSVAISFYTLSCISYLADVHAGRLDAERHAGYLTLFGPSSSWRPHRQSRLWCRCS